MKSTRANSIDRNGYSLLEMMVVMTVVAGMAAVTWPLLKSPLSKMQLQAAAQEVSSELSKARLKAMQSGVAQVFRIQMNTGKFQVSAVSDDDPADETKVSTTEEQEAESAQVSDLEKSPMSDPTDYVQDEKELPEGICFSCPDEIEQPEPQRTEVATSSEGWTDLAVFYPNGDTSNATVSLKGQSDLHVNVKLSGLTGTAKIGEAHRQELR